MAAQMQRATSGVAAVAVEPGKARIRTMSVESTTVISQPFVCDFCGLVETWRIKRKVQGQQECPS